MQPDENPEGLAPLKASVVSPPTQPGSMMAVPAEPKSKWPTVVGVIAIVMGGGSFLMNACGMLSMAMMGTFFSKMPTAGMPGAMPPEMMKMTPAVLVTTGLRFAMGIVLLAIGIGMVQRRSWSVRAIRPWSLVAIVVCLIAAVADYQLQQRNLSLMANSAAMPMPMSQGMFAGMMMVQVAFWLVLRLAFPVFALIWFGRQRIKDEVAGWQAPSA